MLCSTIHCCFVMLALIHTSGAQAGMRIAAFNVRKFGRSKMDKPAVVKVLIDIIQRYDIILVQEILDKNEEAIYELLQQINAESRHRYDIALSERLGTSSERYKEQYAFLYRASPDAGITVKDTHQYPDVVFERPPYSVLIASDNTEVSEFALMAVHTKPKNAVNETDELAVVHERLSALWDTENILIMGDFNADCDYIRAAAKENLVLRKDSKYTWLLGDDIDSTVTNSDCAYDRFVMTGEKFLSSVISGSVKVFRFDTEYGLNQSFSEDVSDHYPIELQLRWRDSTSGNPSVHGARGDHFLCPLVVSVVNLFYFFKV